MDLNTRIQNVFNDNRRLAGRLVSLSAAFMITGCTTTLNVPADAVAFSKYSSTIMQSDNPLEQAQGRLSFLHYALTKGGDEFAQYYESSPELAVVWNDYQKLDKADQKRVRDILNEVNYVRPGTRMEAMEKLAEILPSFQNISEKTPEVPKPEMHEEPETVTVERNEGRLVFHLSGNSPDGP